MGGAPRAGSARTPTSAARRATRRAPAAPNMGGAPRAGSARLPSPRAINMGGAPRPPAPHSQLLRLLRRLRLGRRRRRRRRRRLAPPRVAPRPASRPRRAPADSRPCAWSDSAAKQRGGRAAPLRASPRLRRYGMLALGPAAQLRVPLGAQGAGGLAVLAQSDGARVCDARAQLVLGAPRDAARRCARPRAAGEAARGYARLRAHARGCATLRDAARGCGPGAQPRAASSSTEQHEEQQQQQQVCMYVFLFLFYLK
jgi:hypothetical protein